MLNLNGKTMGEAIALGRALKGALSVIGKTAATDTTEAAEAAAAAYQLIECYPEWTPDGHFTAGRVWRKGSVLYYCQQDHDGLNDPNRAPELYSAGWYPRPDPSEDGSLDHPYTWRSGMEGEYGAYYRDGDLLCVCTRGVPAGYLHGSLQSFVGSYMEVVSA